ncbi:hypothetical protein [Fibrobacter sp. HC4]|uniref:hypothetical protein n=1 Tax=Fibrobacter sp. HC4 TaxID=3239812 RepID=UPI0020199405|nr:hypothetical protein [Fibrobacter succinogenes]MCL4101720.1 hypothetical protein [Fibrobacter succinogenes]
MQYSILWVDDRKDEFLSVEMDQEIEEYVREHFFEPHLDFCENVEDAEKCVSSKKYDVIFSDYNIGENKDGQDFITDIRKSNVNAEVLFYSALHNPPALGLDRISFLRLNSSSAYDDLKAKMKSMIDLTLEKLNDLTNLRGLVMAEVSELDIMMKQIVYHYCDDSEKEKKLHSYIVEKIEKRSKDVLESVACDKNCTHVWKNKNLKEIVFDPGFESFTTARTLYQIIREIKSGNSSVLDQSCLSFTLEEYKSQIIDNRNMLAHCQAFIGNDGKETLKTAEGEKTFNSADIDEIRRNILRYHTMFEALLTYFNLE